MTVLSVPSFPTESDYYRSPVTFTVSASSTRSVIPAFRVSTVNITLGALRKLPSILRHAQTNNISVVGVQEIGDVSPAVIQSLAESFGFLAYVSPSSHAGVALFVPLTWSHCVVTHRVVHEGRAVMALFEIDGIRRWFSSLYLPTALDEISSLTDSKLLAARKIVQALITSASSAASAVLLADMNSTCWLEDRLPQRSRLSLAAALHADLELAGFADSVKSLHPLNTPFSHSSRAASGAVSRSRIDFIYTRGFGVADHVAFRSLSKTNHLQLTLASRVNVATPPLVHSKSPRLPDLRRATDEQKENFSLKLGSLIDAEEGWLANKAHGGVKETDQLFERLSHLCRIAAKQLPWSGGSEHRVAKYHNLDRRLQLLRKVQSSARCLLSSRTSPLVPLSSLASFPTLSKAIRALAQFIVLPSPPDTGDVAQWLQDLQLAVSKCRRQRNKHRAPRVKPPTSLNAKLHYFCRDQSPNGVGSVINPDNGKLVCDAIGVKRLLFNKFKQQFDVDEDWREPPGASDSLASLYRPINIEPRVYAPLVNPFSSSEVLALCRSSRLIVAPGYDQVSAGLIKVAAERAPSLVNTLTLAFNSCLRLRAFPTMGKHALIHPLLKSTASDKLRDLSNIRPISLQPAITKLMMKGLARRLGPILVSHRILHHAQEAYLPGGSSLHCVDTVLDTWEIAKKEKRACFNLFYDLRAAYDTVTKPDLLRALQRISLPPAFVELISDSMTGLTSSVRSLHGETDRFPVLRSIRQGCPLAPLLFVILIDPWHCGLDRNPLYGGLQDGFVLDSKSTLRVSSKGFADDTWITSGSLEGLRRMNEFTERFCIVNHLQLNGMKTELVGVLANGQPFLNKRGEIVVAGVAVPGRPANFAIRYAGVLICMDLSWDEQIKSLNSRFGFHSHIALRHRLPVYEAVYFFNVFLLSKVEHIFRHIVCTTQQVQQWDKSLASTISALAKTSFWPFESHALASLTGLRLPSDQYSAVRISETFLRANSARDTADFCASRLFRRHRSDTVKNNRLLNVVKLASALDISLSRRYLSRGWAQVDNSALAGISTKRVSVRLPDQDAPVSNLLTFGFIGTRTCVHPAAVTITVASMSSSTTSAWAFVVRSKAGVEVTNKFAARFEHTPSSSFLVALMSIAVALFSFPVNWSVTVLSASSSATSAIHSYQQQHSERKRLRMSGRPILSLIHRLCCAHSAHNSAIAFRVLDSSNRLDSADYKAALHSAQTAIVPNRRASAILPSLDWSAGEARCVLQHVDRSSPGNKLPCLDDARSFVKGLQNVNNINKWATSSSQSAFACQEMRYLFRTIAAEKHSASAAACLRLCTNIIHRSSSTTTIGCSSCLDPSCSIIHLLQCSGSSAFRAALLKAVIKRINKASSQPAWFFSNFTPEERKTTNVSAFLRRLFELNDSAGLLDYRFVLGAWSPKEQQRAAVFTQIACPRFWREFRVFLFKSVLLLCRLYRLL